LAFGWNPTENLDWTILPQTFWRHSISPNVIETIYDLLNPRESILQNENLTVRNEEYFRNLTNPVVASEWLHASPGQRIWLIIYQKQGILKFLRRNLL
jgi:hypothetical protein